MEPELFNRSVLGEATAEEMRNTAFEQYKLYVQMADEHSKRRVTGNSFYMTLHTTLYTAVWAFLAKELSNKEPTMENVNEVYVILPFVLLGLVCVVWWLNVRSYDQLNAAKYRVVGELETLFPLKIWSYEWSRLGMGDDRKKYWPISRIERGIPVILALFDLATAILLRIYLPGGIGFAP